MKKKFFVSYASLRSGDAAVVEHFFIRNEMEIVKDTNEKDSYWNFMDQIATVDYVVMLLNNTFFESPLCTYEIVKSYTSGKKIYPIWCTDLLINNEEERKDVYNRLIKQDMNIAPKQKKDFLDKISSFDKYNEIILKLINEVKYPQKGKTIIDACNEIYEAIYKKPAQIQQIEDEMDIRSKHIYDLDYIDNEFLRSEFIWLIGDLMRCSSFRTSLFAEDSTGEKEWKFKQYNIRKGSMGLSLYIYATSMEGKEQIIDIHNICDVKFNQNCDESFLKYYMTVIDRQLYNRYLQEMKLPENMRDKKILSQFERYGKMNHRIILKFDDNNALENMNFK